MNAIVSCKDHDHSRRSIYDICETNEGGEVSQCHTSKLSHIIENSNSYPISRQPFRFMFRLTNRHQWARLMGFYARLEDLTTSYTPGPNPPHQTPLRHSPALLPVPNVTNAVPSSLQHFTPHRNRTNTCVTNVISKQPRTLVVRVAWV